jgi:rhomboid protease GluP
MRERATTLVQKYPNDPRSHYYLGEALAAANDNSGTERELRLAAAKAAAHVTIFGARAEFVFRGTLAVFLAEQGKHDEAIDLARGICSALTDDKTAAALLKALAAQNLCN